MKYSRQLRWRIVGAHFAVVLVGVTVLTFMVEAVMLRKIAIDVQQYVLTVVDPQSAEQIQQIIDDLLGIFRRAIFYALPVAALGAVLAGLLNSLFLLREILQPLKQITHVSRRIADGSYTDRVPVPTSKELAQVATNFNQMAQSLQQVEQQRIALLGNVSHELRTPLTGLEGYLQGMIDGHFPGNPQTFEAMYREVRRLKRLVNDIQILTRVESGQIALKPERFDLVRVVEQVSAQLKPQADEKSIALTVTVPTEPVTIRTDRDRVTQVIINLIDNAIRYTPANGQVTVCITDNNCAEVTVRDTGIGIPTDALPYIFERFYRTNLSRSHSRHGRGIGLTISRHLARAMGGELTAASDGPGKGSTFTFELPLAAQQ